MQNDISLLQAVMEDYFLGTFAADKTRLLQAFHPDCQITGNINGQSVVMNLIQFIERVTQAKQQSKSERRYDKKIVGMDWHQDIAWVKAKVLVDENYFTDYITLLKIDGRWFIRQKSFTYAIV